MARIAEAHDDDLGFQIAPMIDVIFVLMLFFMASVGMQKRESGLAVVLPGDPVAGRGTAVSVFLLISANGEISIDGQSYDSTGDRRLPELRAWLRHSFVEIGGNNATLILQPSPDTQHERITDVLSAAADAGVEKLTFN